MAKLLRCSLDMTCGFRSRRRLQPAGGLSLSRAFRCSRDPGLGPASNQSRPFKTTSSLHLVSGDKSDIRKTLDEADVKVHEFHAPRMLDLVLVRHGESEGNVARKRSMMGDHSLYKGEFKNRHSSRWRLTDQGREQAQAAGEWIKNNIARKFDRYYVSEYLRAWETAALLDLPGAQWFSEPYIRERDWGQLDLMSQAERLSKMGDELKRRDLDRFFYAPPGGESLAAVAQRSDRLLETLHRECAEKKVIVVCHGEVMWALRTRIERMGVSKFIELQETGRMVDQLHNGHVLHYTRRNPHTGAIEPFFSYFRSVTPWNPRLSLQHWQKIQRPVYDNELLLAEAERYPRMFETDEDLENLIDESILDVDKRYLLGPQRKISPKLKEEAKGQPLTIKKALVVVKSTRYESELARLGEGVSEEKLRKEIALRGFFYDRIKRIHDQHVSAVEDVEESLQKQGIEYKIVRTHHLKSSDVEGCDCVVAAGGDGTLLKSASAINLNIPLIGINTDARSSEGFLSCCAVGPGETSFEEVLKRLSTGDYWWTHRCRIKITLIHPDGRKEEVPHYALNEVFIAERDPARPIVHDIGIDNNQREVQRSSGIIACTGTGSTAWFYSAASVHREQISDALKTAGVSLAPETMTEITESLNKRNVFEAETEEMGYIVREPIINDTFGEIRSRSGRARRISVKSLGLDTILTMDCLTTIPLEYGVQAVLTVDKERGGIKTVTFQMPRLYAEGK